MIQLTIRKCIHLTDESIIAISSSNRLKNLKILDIGFIPNITTKSLELIGRSKYLIKLEEFRISGCEKILKQ